MSALQPSKRIVFALSVSLLNFLAVALLASDFGQLRIVRKPIPDTLVTLGGEVGAADKASLNRFSSAPFDSLAWIRADLTGEKASESDDAGLESVVTVSEVFIFW